RADLAAARRSESTASKALGRHFTSRAVRSRRAERAPRTPEHALRVRGVEDRARESRLSRRRTEALVLGTVHFGPREGRGALHVYDDGDLPPRTAHRIPREKLRRVRAHHGPQPS